MADPEELIEQRRAELLALGYRLGVVNLALEWAEQSAEGSGTYFMQPAVLFLPRYLQDTEKYLKGLHLDTDRLTPRAGGVVSPDGQAHSGPTLSPGG